MDLEFRFHCWRRDISNFALIRHRDFQGFLVTGQNSGTQWLKYMLGLALAKHYGVSPPRYVNNPSSNELIGHPKHRRIYPHLPRIASTHSIPHIWFDSRLLRRMLRFPPYAVLIRDMRDALVSNYEKYKERYGVPFSEYLRGDPSGHRYVIDIWWYMHFLNRWGRVVERFPEQALVIRYEDMKENPKRELERLCRHFGLELESRVFDDAVAESSKEKMLSRVDPDINDRIIRKDTGGRRNGFSPEENEIFREIVQKNLKYTLGYEYGL